MLSGTLHVPAEGATAVGIVLNTTSVHAGCPSGPCDKGPDVGWDRPGNDEHCFSVNDTFTATDCARACDRDPKCQAWTLVSKPAKHPANAQQLPCSRGLPLTRPYCTLKAPFPDRAITRSPTATTGVPARAMANLHNKTQSTLTAMMMDIDAAAHKGSTRVWEIVVGAGSKSLRDVSGPFPCGPRQTCLPATTVSASPGSLPFLLYCRHGTMELYVGDALLLVQTTVYGKYPQALADVGFAIEGTAEAKMEISDLKAWSLNLEVH